MKVTPEFLEKYNKPGPRYTSYPPATSFNANFTADEFIPSIESSNNASPDNISIYMHIPFCRQRCFFCGCNTSEYKDDQTIERYINCVIKEIDTFASYLDKKRKVTQIHFGGGTPNAIKLQLLGKLVDRIRHHMSLTDNCEISVECNPAYIEYADIELMASFGFNRISLGIQDFHEDVMKAINRKSSKNPLDKVFECIRKIISTVLILTLCMACRCRL